MSRNRGFTLGELVTVVVLAVILLILVSALLPPRGGSYHHAPQMQNSTQVRGQQQGLVIYAQSNNTWLPGIGTNGLPLAAGLKTTGNPNADGSVVGSRYWILLQGSFISPQLMINPMDTSPISVWTTGAVETSNYSYAMLCITTKSRDAGRQAEWRDNANGAAPLISDRNAGSDNLDNDVRSLWTRSNGSWTGSVVFGDNHVSFQQSNVITTTTIYNGIQTSNDNLFASRAAPGVTDSSTDSTANAYMVTVN